MSKHTPGPWGIMGNPFDSEMAIGPESGVRVAYIRPDDNDRTDESLAADAMLIAAAPDMLAALKRFVAHGTDDTELLALASAAITRAEDK